MTKNRRSDHLTAREIDALLSVAHNADAWATFEDTTRTRRELLRDHAAFERANAKLLARLGELQRRARKRRDPA